MFTFHRITVAQGTEIAGPGHIAIQTLALISIKLATVAAVLLAALAVVAERASPPLRTHNALAIISVEDAFVAVLLFVETLLVGEPTPWLGKRRMFVAHAPAVTGVKS